MAQIYVNTIMKVNEALPPTLPPTFSNHYPDKILNINCLSWFPNNILNIPVILSDFVKYIFNIILIEFFNVFVFNDFFLRENILYFLPIKSLD